MRPLALAVILIAAPTSAAGNTYPMRGPCHVKTTSGPFVVDETYNPVLKATVTGPDKDLVIEVEGEGMKCTLHGALVGTAITLAAGQKCPQKINRDGVHADLDGTLTSGKGTLVGKTLTLKTKWDVAGKVRIAFKKMNVAGTVDTDVKGTRA